MDETFAKGNRKPWEKIGRLVDMNCKLSFS